MVVVVVIVGKIGHPVDDRAGAAHQLVFLAPGRLRTAARTVADSSTGSPVPSSNKTAAPKMLF
jgi:hypothetical protein